MKKYKKIVFGIIIITIIAIAICSNISLGTSSTSGTSKYTAAQFHSKQAPRPTGTTYTLNGEDAAILYDNVYSIEYGNPLTWENHTYNVKYKVEFRGSKASFYDMSGNLAWESTTKDNATVGAILTPNSLVSERVLYESSGYLGGAGVGVIRMNSFSMHSEYEEAANKEHRVYSGAQGALWQAINDGWMKYCEVNGGINGIDYSGWEGPDLFYAAVDPYSNSRNIGELCTLNLDVYILHNDEEQDLFLVYPYGENLPPEEPEEPVTEVTNITVTKKWEDDNDRDGLRPDNITVILYANGTAYETATFGGTGNEWTYQFTNVPTKNSDGSTILYTIKETLVNGYQTTQQSVYKSE